MLIRSQIGCVRLLVDVAEGIVPVEIGRILVPGSGSRSSSGATASAASGCVVAVVEVVHIAVVALDLIVDIVVGAAARVECAGIFIALATIARKKVLPRVTAEIVPVVVGAHPRQDLIVQCLGSCLLLLRSDTVAVQVATVVQIV